MEIVNINIGEEIIFHKLQFRLITHLKSYRYIYMKKNTVIDIIIFFRTNMGIGIQNREVQKTESRSRKTE